jgi:hypothetical protein
VTRTTRITLALSLLTITWALCAAAPAVTLARSRVVRAGDARFEVLTSTLVRLEFARDHAFENAPTLTVTRAQLPVPRFTAVIRSGTLTIRTARITLSYRIRSGPFTDAQAPGRWTEDHRAPERRLGARQPRRLDASA